MGVHGPFTLLTLFWVVIWILDFQYYNRLLEGAVRAIMAIERAGKPHEPLGSLGLSIAIENAVRRKSGNSNASYPEDAAEKTPSTEVAELSGELEPLSGGVGRWVFYTLVCIGLAVGAIVFWCLWWHARAGGPLTYRVGYD